MEFTCRSQPLLLHGRCRLGSVQSRKMYLTGGLAHAKAGCCSFSIIPPCPWYLVGDDAARCRDILDHTYVNSRHPFCCNTVGYRH